MIGARIAIVGTSIAARRRTASLCICSRRSVADVAAQREQPAAEVDAALDARRQQLIGTRRARLRSELGGAAEGFGLADTAARPRENVARAPRRRRRGRARRRAAPPASRPNPVRTCIASRWFTVYSSSRMRPARAAIARSSRLRARLAPYDEAGDRRDEHDDRSLRRSPRPTMPPPTAKSTASRELLQRGTARGSGRRAPPGAACARGARRRATRSHCSTRPVAARSGRPEQPRQRRLGRPARSPDGDGFREVTERRTGDDGIRTNTRREPAGRRSPHAGDAGRTDADRAGGEQRR